MQSNKRLLSIVFLFIVGLTSLQAQETIPASGGNATGAGGSVSYTVGQVVYQSAANLIPGSNTIYIDARDLPAGVYTMSVKTSTLNISKSIIIE